MYRFYYHPRYTRTRALKSTQKKSITIGELSGQYYFGQKGQSYCSQRGQSCLAKRVKVAWLFQAPRCAEFVRIAHFCRIGIFVIVVWAYFCRLGKYSGARITVCFPQPTHSSEKECATPLPETPRSATHNNPTLYNNKPLMSSIFPFRHETAHNATTTGYFLQPGLPPPDHGGKKKEGANPVKTDLHPLAEKKGPPSRN